MSFLIARRALLEYMRRPLNLVLLFGVPIVIVVAMSGELASFAKLFRGTASPAHLELATAGWASAAMAGLAGFFQVHDARSTDRRLALSSGRVASVVAGRLGAIAILALLAASAAFVALEIREGVTDPARVVGAILLVAVIYASLGALVGTLVHSEMNGALLITVIWMLDVFVGAGLGANVGSIARLFPQHFPTQVLIGQASGHAGPIGDVGWSFVWAAALLFLAVARMTQVMRLASRRDTDYEGISALKISQPDFASSTSTLRVPANAAVDAGLRISAEDSAPFQPRKSTPLIASVLAAARDYGRNRILWVLLISVPILFIALAAAETPTTPIAVALSEGPRQVIAMISLRQIHAVQMATIATALLAGVVGLFVVTGSLAGDRRLVLAGFRPRQVLAGHLGVISGATVLSSAVALATSSAWITPRQWIAFATADVLIAGTYAMIGVLLGPLVGRLGGLYLVLLLAFVDVGYGQSVMFGPRPPGWGAFLPGRAGGHIAIEGVFGSGFGQLNYLLVGIVWFALLFAAAVLVFKLRIGNKARFPKVATGIELR